MHENELNRFRFYVYRPEFVSSFIVEVPISSQKGTSVRDRNLVDYCRRTHPKGSKIFCRQQLTVETHRPLRDPSHLQTTNDEAPQLQLPPLARCIHLDIFTSAFVF